MYINTNIMNIPNFFTDKEQLLKYDFTQLQSIIGSDIDYSFHIPNLSLQIDPIDYLKSIIYGYNHIYIQNITNKINPNANICLPLIHDWTGSSRIDNIVIISNPDDAEKISNKHIKKTPIFSTFLDTSIISTLDNDDWKEQRDRMNLAFLPKLSLQKIFPISQARARECVYTLQKISNNFTSAINISEFFLNETQAQLQLAMFGFSPQFEKQTNKKIRNAFSGINTDYIYEFSEKALEECYHSDGPLSKILSKYSDQYEKTLGNLRIFAFAGHDTTSHTLTWLIYELCKHPEYKRELIKEIKEYWLRNNEESYLTFHELPFMTKCITETLRLWPALANGTYRELEYDEIVTGIDGEPVTIPKGTYCQIINWTRHRNQLLWGHDVNIFNPYREFKDSEIWSYKGFGTYNVSSDRYSPFSYSPRNCIGKNFSQMEMRLILLNIFKHFDFELDTKQDINSNNPNYMGLNTFTLGPYNIYDTDELLGMFVKVIPNNSRL